MLDRVCFLGKRWFLFLFLFFFTLYGRGWEWRFLYYTCFFLWLPGWGVLYVHGEGRGIDGFFG